MRYVATAMLMILTCLDLGMAQAASPDERESLRGLDGVEVVIEGIRPDAQKDGLSQDIIRTAVEHILRSDGIKTLAQSETSEMPSLPWLYIRVDTIKILGASVHAFYITVELHQSLSLAARPQQNIHAVTWHDGSLGYVSTTNIGQVVHDVKQHVNAFAHDYRAVNTR